MHIYVSIYSSTYSFVYIIYPLIHSHSFTHIITIIYIYMYVYIYMYLSVNLSLNSSIYTMLFSPYIYLYIYLYMYVYTSTHQWLVCVPLEIHLEPINQQLMLLVNSDNTCIIVNNCTIWPKRELTVWPFSLVQWSAIWAYEKLCYTCISVYTICMVRMHIPLVLMWLLYMHSHYICC